jgi:carboxypeptidase Q
MLRNVRYLLPLVALLLPFPTFAGEANLQVVHQVKEQAFHHSKVMDYLHMIADENGPRLTGSPGFDRAAQLVIKGFKTDGIRDVGLESWGVFGRGWNWSRIAVQMTKPQQTTLSAYPGDWSAATDGPVTGEVIFAPLWEERDKPTELDFEKSAHQLEAYKQKYRGKLQGKIILLNHPVIFKQPEEREPGRFTDEQLADISKAKEPGVNEPLEWPLLRSPVDPDERRRQDYNMPLEIMVDQMAISRKLRNRLAAFFLEEKVAGVLVNGWSRSAAVIMHSDYGSYVDGDPIPPPTAVLMSEHYNRIHRLLERNVPVEIELDVDARFYGPAIEGVNVIAQIPGSELPGEVVMLGAHLDSWHGSTGATDNAAGVAVVMEAMRILKALDLPMKRTVRAALWSGEEQGLIGSRRYVQKHFGDPVTMQLKPDHGKVSVYFNLDNGGGRIRGIYLQENDMARPLFEAWLAPFADMNVKGPTIINTGGTDHLSFDAVGIPGFGFVQDPLNYDSDTHHSNVDDVGHIAPGDLMQAAAVMAATVYHAATSEESVPRKPLPQPLPPKKPLPAILRDS